MFLRLCIKFYFQMSTQNNSESPSKKFRAEGILLLQINLFEKKIFVLKKRKRKNTDGYKGECRSRTRIIIYVENGIEEKETCFFSIVRQSKVSSYLLSNGTTQFSENKILGSLRMLGLGCWP